MNSNLTPLFLFGNGLSIALAPDFSLKEITRNFLSDLSGEEKEFLVQICGGSDNLNFDNFEENFSRIEDAYNSLQKYNSFIKSPVGINFLNNFKLRNPELDKHELIIKSIYHKYIFKILNIIRNKITKQGIQSKLTEFSKFIKETLSNKKGFVFTLNYDLLAETISWITKICYHRRT